MPKELIDDQLWSLIEPLLSKQVPRRPKASARPSSAHWYRIRAALGNCVEPDAAGNGLRLRHSLLATAWSAKSDTAASISTAFMGHLAYVTFSRARPTEAL